jgi:fructose-1,6-bisphosphatase/inositol monophosphatase family enzyme
MKTHVDIEAVGRLIREVAAVEILPRFGRLAPGDIRSKSNPNDLVTAADLAAERELTARLPDLLPGSLVVGEEGVAADPARLDLISGEAPVWLVDPVDGTSNFAKGKPQFGVMVALVVGGRSRAGWILDPMNGNMAVAEEGSGAFIGRTRLVLPEPPPFAELKGALYRREKRLIAAVASVMGFASAAQDYLAMVEGRLDFALFSRLMPWDHAAGSLIHREAGGYSAVLADGAPYVPTRREGGILIASSRERWEAIRALVDL